jgi:predicted N-acetyltransferase YhbS
MKIEYLADHPEFIPTLALWFHRHWGHLSPGSTSETVAAELRSHLQYNQMPLALVAVSGGQLVGSASLRLHDMRTRKDLSPWLANVYVPVAHRKQGLGARLVAAIEEKANDLGFAALYLWTDEQERFYTRLGWTVIDRLEYLGEQVVMMQKRLGGTGEMTSRIG